MSVTVVWNGDAFQKELKREIVDLIGSIAYVLRGEVSKVLSLKKSPPVSNVGSPPNQDKGILAGSWRAYKPTATGNIVRASIGSNLIYAKVHELSKKFPRPYVQKAIKNADKRVKTITNVEAMVARAIARVGG
jgi:phage gpG-like protein